MIEFWKPPLWVYLTHLVLKHSQGHAEGRFQEIPIVIITSQAQTSVLLLICGQTKISMMYTTGQWPSSKLSRHAMLEIFSGYKNPSVTITAISWLPP